MAKKLTSIVLTLCMMLSVLTVAPFTLQATAATTTSSGLASNVQDGQILQCWNWSFNNIKSNMSKIAAQGFSAIQTSPIQCTKESTTEYYSNMKNSWWVYYQPTDFKIETNSYNALGTASEFKAMCTEAHKYGVKVIVDAVLNHTANNGSNTISSMVPADLRNDSSCWHDITKNSWYESRYDITQFCMEGIPDLNTGNTKVQNYAIKFLKECIDAGADGFRFDGAKHIEVPTDFSYASQFWPNVINATTSYAKSTRGITPFYYGEVLDGPSGSNDKSNAQTALDSYMKYMSVTQSSVSNSVRNAVNSKNAQTAARTDFYYDDGSKSTGTKSVLWNESHDTYVSGSSSGVSDTVMKKTWAIVGSRKDACGMYMARPSNVSSTKLGAADTTAWSATEVKAVNWFKNNFIGQSEYLSNTEAIVCNERGTTGAILVNVSGTSTSASVNSHVLEAGTYNDAITGNTFTVANNKITGNIGSSGIAVLRKNATTSTTQPTTSSSSGSSSSSTGKACTIYFDNSSYNWSSVYAYVYTDDGSQNAAWPGTKMTLDSSTGYYKLSVPASLGNGRVIFTQSSTTTTNRYPADGQTGMAIESTDKIFKANHSWTEYTGTTPTIYFDNSSYNWSSVYAYVYTDDGSQNAAWPGKKMTYDSSTGYYKLSVSSSLKNGKVIFTESSTATTNRYPADQQPGLDINDKDMVFKANKMWSEYSPTSDVGIALSADAVVMSAGATARVTTSDASGTVTYSSANTSVATVTKNSNTQATVTAKSAGTTTVTAKDSTGNSDKIIVNVGANGTITLGSTSLSLAVGKYAYITEDSSNTVTWTSSDTSVATVSRYSSTKGKVTAVKAGTATITAKDTTGATATCKVTVTAGSITLGSTSLSLTAGKYAYITEDSSNTVTWTSSNTSVATVSRYSSTKGKVTGVKAGTATITATDTTGATATCKVTVTAGSITLGSTSLSLTAGNYAYITEDSSNTVTWTSSDTSVATVSRYSSAKGKVTAKKAGTATITATDTTGATATCKVTVTAASNTSGSTSGSSSSNSSSSSSSSSSSGTSSGKTYTLVTSAPSDWSGDYVLVGKSGTTTYILDASGSYQSTNIGTTSAAKTLSDAGITASGNTLTNVPDQYVYTIGKTDSYYYLKMKNSTNYLTYKQNNLTTSTSNSGTTSQWSISLSSGVAKMTNRSASTYNLTFNSSSKMFRCYSSSNSYKLYLYKVS